MAETEQKQSYPLAPANDDSRSDQESTSENAKALRRKKHIQYLLYIVIFAVFQIGVITLFAMTIMKFRNPKFRVRSANFDTFETTPTSFNARMNVELGVKNTNFGRFRYQNTTIDFYHGDTRVGEAMVYRARANWRSTRKFHVTVDLSTTNITNNSQLSNDLISGIFPLRSESRMRGKVTIMLIMKKNRNANMNCTMNVAIQTRELQNLMCN